MKKKDRKVLKFGRKNLYLEVGAYTFGGELSILAYTKNGLYGDITINLNGMMAEEYGGFIEPLTKSCGLEKRLIEEGIIKEVIGSVSYNLEKYDEVIFDLEKLKEYDPEGIEEILKEENEEEFE